MAALIGTGVLATPASAHNGDRSVTCDSVTVKLTAYSGKATNSVVLSVEGGDVLTSVDSFGRNFDYTHALPDHTSAIRVHLVVKAGDSQHYNRDEYKTSEPCEQPPTTPPVTPTTPATTPATTPPTTAAPTTVPATPTTPAGTATATTNAPVVAGTGSTPVGGDLAETGGSSSTPMIAGIAAAVVAAGGGLLFLNRRRSAAHR